MNLRLKSLAVAVVLLLLLCFVPGQSAFAQTTVLSDPFTGTNGTDLTAAHGSVSAGAWIKNTGMAAHFLIQSNQAQVSTTNTDVLYDVAGTSSLGDCDVSVDVYQIASDSGTYIGVVTHNNGTDASGYYANFINSGGGTNVQITRKNGGSQTVLAGPTSVSISASTNTTLHESVRAISGGEEIKLYWGGTLILTADDTSGSQINSGYEGIANYTGNVAGYVLDNFLLTTPTSAATTYTLSGPTTGSIGVAGTYTVQASGNLASSVTITPAVTGGGTLSPGTVTLSSGSSPSNTFTYTAASSGSKVISTTNSSGLTDPSSITDVVSASAVTILPNDSHIWWSPGAVRFDSSNIAYLIENGTYAKLAFTGTSLSASVSVADYGSLSSATYPSFFVRVDGGRYSFATVTGTGTLPLLTGLASGSHVAEVVYYDEDESQTWNTASAGGSGMDRLRISAFVLDGGAAIASLPSSGFGSVKTSTVLFLGDSITHGFDGGSNVNLPMASEPSSPLYTWTESVKSALNADETRIGHSGDGFLNTNNSLTGPIYTAISSPLTNYDSTYTRVFPSAGYTYCVVNLGTNDTADITSSVTSFTATVRSLVGSACKIIYLTPFNGTHDSQITTGLTAYTSAHPSDSLIYHVNPSALYTITTVDGTHPDTVSELGIGSAAAGQIIGSFSTAGVLSTEVINSGTSFAQELVELECDVDGYAQTAINGSHVRTVTYKALDNATTILTVTLTYDSGNTHVTGRTATLGTAPATISGAVTLDTVVDNTVSGHPLTLRKLLKLRQAFRRGNAPYSSGVYTYDDADGATSLMTSTTVAPGDGSATRTVSPTWANL